jgi:nicotinate-nucleotide pyrophosphorylase (carboxylating)
VINENKICSASIICKTNYPVIVAGLEESDLIFEMCDSSTKYLVKDGDEITAQPVQQVLGDAKSILKAERTALNLIMRMSGIATATRKLVKIVEAISKDIRIASTRKTAPGLRLFDKRAVKLGGGFVHRLSLDQQILIKDNHVAISGSVKEAIKRAKSNSPNRKIECEVWNTESALEAISGGADILMLDNFSAADVSDTIATIAKKGLRNRCMIEVSGGISLQNVREYALSLPDIISVGSLTHTVKAVDFSLEIDD